MSLSARGATTRVSSALGSPSGRRRRSPRTPGFSHLVVRFPRGPGARFHAETAGEGQPEERRPLAASPRRQRGRCRRAAVMWSVACCSSSTLLLPGAESQSPAGRVLPWHSGTLEVGVRLRPCGRLSWPRTCDGDACNGSVKQCGDLIKTMTTTTNRGFV